MICAAAADGESGGEILDQVASVAADQPPQRETREADSEHEKPVKRATSLSEAYRASIAKASASSGSAAPDPSVAAQ